MTQATRFRVKRGGAPALRLLRSEVPLRLAAVFERSFYLESGGAFACLGASRIGLGPLNAVLDAPEDTNWPASGLTLETRCLRASHAIHLGPRFVLSLEEASLWHPEAPPARPDPAAVARVLQDVQDVCARHCALHDLAVGRTGMAGAGRWLAAVLAGAPAGEGDDMSWVQALIGLGPGLTPSGDDFIGGILIALHVLGHTVPARLLAKTALAAAAPGTTAISAAHLAAAGEGQGSAALHALLNDVLCGRHMDLETRLAAVGRIGHTSGWDTLAGSLAVLDAWLAGTAARRSAA